jgi:hypothetical protein
MALARTDISKEYTTPIIRTKRISDLGTMLTLSIETRCSSEISVLRTATRRNIPEDGILHNFRLGNLKSYNIRIYSEIKFVFVSRPFASRIPDKRVAELDGSERDT